MENRYINENKTRNDLIFSQASNSKRNSDYGKIAEVPLQAEQ